MYFWNTVNTTSATITAINATTTPNIVTVAAAAPTSSAITIIITIS